MIARPVPHYRRHGTGAGVWLVAAVALLLAPHFSPAGTPAAPAPPGKPAAAVPPGQRAAAPSGWALAANPRITTTRSHGCDPARDLRSGRLDPRVRELLAGAARAYPIRVSCVRTGHSTYVKGTGRISNHTAWRAVDLDMVDGRPVSRRNPCARDLAWRIGRLGGRLTPSEVGSPWTFGGGRPWFSDDGHQGHIHIGYGRRG
jgi:hypothetical protein